MKRESLVLLAGLLILVLPFLGFPSDWKRIAYVVLGALLVLLGYQLRRSTYLRSMASASGERSSDAYVESPAPEAPRASAGTARAKRV